jgi:hypothetical protein
MPDSLTASQLLFGLLDLVEEMQSLNKVINVDRLGQAGNDLFYSTFLHGSRPVREMSGSIGQRYQSFLISSTNWNEDTRILRVAMTARSHNPKTRFGKPETAW